MNRERQLRVVWPLVELFDSRRTHRSERRRIATLGAAMLNRVDVAIQMLDLAPDIDGDQY